MDAPEQCMGKLLALVEYQFCRNKRINSKCLEMSRLIQLDIHSFSTEHKTPNKDNKQHTITSHCSLAQSINQSISIHTTDEYKTLTRHIHFFAKHKTITNTKTKARSECNNRIAFIALHYTYIPIRYYNNNRISATRQ